MTDAEDDPPSNRAYTDLKSRLEVAVSLDELVDDVAKIIKFCYMNPLNGDNKKAGGFRAGGFFIRSDFSPHLLSMLERMGLITKQETTIGHLRYRKFKKDVEKIYFSLENSDYFNGDSNNVDRK